MLLRTAFVQSTPSSASGRSVRIEEEKELEHQVEYFAAQREMCLAEASNLLWQMLSHEALAEVSIEVVFDILETAAIELGENRDDANLISNKLKWNDQSEDYVLADCSTVVRVLSTALWGSARDLDGISMLRIFWHSAVELFGKIIVSAYFKFAATNEEDGSFSLIRTNYFIKQASVLVVDVIGALEKVVVVGIGNSLEIEATDVEETEHGKVAHILMFTMKAEAGSGRKDVS